MPRADRPISIINHPVFGFPRAPVSSQARSGYSRICGRLRYPFGTTSTFCLPYQAKSPVRERPSPGRPSGCALLVSERHLVICIGQAYRTSAVGLGLLLMKILYFALLECVPHPSSPPPQSSLLSVAGVPRTSRPSRPASPSIASDPSQSRQVADHRPQQQGWVICSAVTTEEGLAGSYYVMLVKLCSYFGCSFLGPVSTVLGPSSTAGWWRASTIFLGSGAEYMYNDGISGDGGR